MQDLLIIRPANGFVISSGYGFGKYKAVSKTQFHRMNVSANDYEREVMDARVPAFPGFFRGHGANAFVKLGEMELPLGFRLHGITSKRAVLVGRPSEEKLLNNPTNSITAVRYNGEEPVRHKQIDLLGVIGAVPGRFENVEIFAFKTGHVFLIDAFKRLQREGILRQE
jgi:UDP-3-O-acyl-N-acetylglucosamine deacetylase